MTADEQKLVDDHMAAASAGLPLDDFRVARQRVLDACAKELRIVLDKHGCALVAVPQLMPDGSGVFKIGARVELKVLP